MVKKSNKASSSKASEPVLTSDWNPTGVLTGNDNNSSTMKEEKFSEIKMLFDDNVEFVLPHQTVGADWYRQGWVCFYYYPFEIGMRFPFSRLVVDTLTELDVSPGQLMSSAWRILACLDSIEEKHKFGINVAVIRQCYSTKKYGGGRVGLVSKNKEDPLILNLETVNDRGWKEDFFFMEKTNLGVDGEFLREQWNNKELCLGADEPDPIAMSIVEKIIALPGKDRLWPNCLGRPIRNAGPVDVDKYFEKVGKALVKYDAVVSERSVAKTAAGRTRSKRSMNVGTPKSLVSPSKSVLSVSSESEDDPKTKVGVESALAHQLKEFKSPNLLNLNISSKDLFSSKRSRDEKSTETDSSRATVAFSPDAKRVKIADDQSIVIRKQSVVRQMPIDQYSVGAKPTEFVDSLSSSLLPQTIEAHSSKDADLLVDETVGNLFHSFQSALMLRESRTEERKKLKDLEAGNKVLLEKLRLAQVRASDLSKNLKTVQREYDEFAGRVNEMHAKFAEDSRDAVIESMMRTRAEMMLEYKKGDWNSWAVDETIKEYNDKYPSRALSLDNDDVSEHQALNDVAQHVDDDEGVEEDDPTEGARDDDQGGAPDNE